MSVSTKVLIFLGSALFLGMLGFIVYQQHQLSVQQKTIETEMVAQKQLIDNITRSQSQWATKEQIDQLIKDNGLNLKAIQDDLAKLHAEITAVDAIVVDSKGQQANNLPSTSTGPTNPNPQPPGKCKDGTTCPNSDPFGYMTKQQNLAVDEDFGNIKIPFGVVGFSAWLQNPWSINIFPREYNVTTVVGTDENERNYFYNKFSVKVNDKTYAVNINSATSETVLPEAKFSWWNPRLLLGMDAGINVNQTAGEFVPSLSLGVMSYGKFKTTPDISILEVGMGYGIVNKKPQVVITPFAYNLGQVVPLIKNTYVGPSLGISTNGDFSVMAGLRVAL